MPHPGDSGDCESPSGELSVWFRFRTGWVLLKKLPFADSRVALLLPAYPGIVLPPQLFSDLYDLTDFALGTYDGCTAAN